MKVLSELKNINENKFKMNLLTYFLIHLFTFSILFAPIQANAESLFTLGATQNYTGVPRSLFGGVQAHQIGDLISIRMAESVSLSDNLTYSSGKSSTTTDSFTSFIS